MKKKYLILTLTIVTLCFVSAFNVNAEAPSNPKSITNTDSSTQKLPQSITNPDSRVPSKPISTFQNPIHANNVTELLNTVVDIAINIGAIIAVIMFIVIGFKFVLAQGNETELKTAKEWFMYAVIGTAILISSKVIVEVVKSTLISAGVVNQDLFNKKP
jgi:hypothetical protein